MNRPLALINPFLCTDGYKTSHYPMYPNNIVRLYSNLTPRSSKRIQKIVKLKSNSVTSNFVLIAGIQMGIQELHDMFNEGFFKRDKKEVINEIKSEYELYLGNSFNTSHIEGLHDLGYLPIKVKALQEGTLCPIGVPLLTIYNTVEGYAWLTNFLETLLSNLLWKPITSSTLAYYFRANLESYAIETTDSIEGVDFQAHDFSMRGLDSCYAAMSSGIGHAVNFYGSDTLPVINAARYYYDTPEGGVVYSVPATEHSVMCAHGKQQEVDTFRELMSKFPTGILSIVSDTWDLWKVLTEYLPQLKQEIESRDGKIVIRPDSGNPVDIVCGTQLWYNKEEFNFNRSKISDQTVEQKGAIELLWDVFGGTVNEQGYKVLNPKIGLIYGDGITFERQVEILERLKAKGFASTNVVFGVGSFMYQNNTRDSFGFAMKATYCELRSKSNENYGKIESRNIFKDPATDSGTKRSAKGLLQVYKDGQDNIQLRQECEWEQERKGLLKTIYSGGRFINRVTLEQIRENVKNTRVLEDRHSS